MRFDDYHISLEVKRNLAKAGFTKPTDIQFKSIRPILKGEDVLAIAQTGTGKTAAFAIPLIDKIHRHKNLKRADGIKCLVMVPTRELAMQIGEVFKKLANHTKVKSFCVTGGVEQNAQIAKLEKGIDILVATPGRMFDLISQGHIKLNRVNTLVLDEADHMLDLGFIKDIKDISFKLPKQRQTLFFSATINERIKKLAYSLIHGNAIRIQISPKDRVSKNVEHRLLAVEMDEKRFYLERLITENSDEKVLVFVRTKVRAERVMKAMDRVGIAAKTIHGDKDQEDRSAALAGFRSGKVKVLIATDVSARGIDIEGVEYVVNYDLPDVAENYVHRVGRTGRGKHKGKAISFCSEAERPILDQIEGFLGNPIEMIELSNADKADTLDFSKEVAPDWKSLMEQDLGKPSKSKKKRKK